MNLSLPDIALASQVITAIVELLGYTNVMLGRSGINFILFMVL